MNSTRHKIEHPAASGFQIIRGTLTIRGWFFDADGKGAQKIDLSAGSGFVAPLELIERMDVYDAFRNRGRDVEKHVGFHGEVDLPKGLHRLRILATTENGQTICLRRCWVYAGRKRKKTSRDSRKDRKLLSRLFFRNRHWTRKNNLKRNTVLRNLYRADLLNGRPGNETAAGRDETVDIIIPVYDGYEETKACIESVVACRQHNKTCFEIIAIEDRSPDPRIVQFLESLHRDKAITLLRNDQNLGFVLSVNRGLCRHPKRDCIILNSDTRTCRDWIDRLKKSAYGSKTTGTVTPFSNRATICSYPVIAEDNGLPQGMSLEDLYRLFRIANDRMTEEIPTGVGFCMFMKREVLDAVGHFDVASFKRGYGEENDFCKRIELAGYRNIIAADTFVYHEGSVSFQGERTVRVRNALQKLNRYFPGYDQEIREFITTDPLGKYRLEVDLLRLTSDRKPIVVFIGNRRGGGTLKHMVELSEYLDEDVRILLLKPGTAADRYELVFLPENSPINYGPNGASFTEIIALFKQIRVVRLHYHHTADYMSDAVYNLPEILDLPYDFTVHDYHPFCPFITLTDEDGRYDPALEEKKGCIDEIRRRPVSYIRDIRKWFDHNEKLLTDAERVICPSRIVMDRIRPHFPGAQINVVPHLESGAEMLRRKPEWKKAPGEELRVLLIGALSREKGADMLEAVATCLNRKGIPVRFTLLGYAYRKLSRLKNLTVTGKFEDAAIFDLMEEIRPHVAWFPALWPETYSYALSRAMQCGLPIIAPDIGAFPERLSGRKLSWIVPWNISVEAICSLFISLHEQGAEADWPDYAVRQENNTEHALSSCSQTFYRKEYLCNTLKPGFKQLKESQSDDWQATG